MTEDLWESLNEPELSCDLLKNHNLTTEAVSKKRLNIAIKNIKRRKGYHQNKDKVDVLTIKMNRVNVYYNNIEYKINFNNIAYKVKVAMDFLNENALVDNIIAEENERQMYFSGLRANHYKQKVREHTRQ
jgi:hypothetical protein